MATLSHAESRRLYSWWWDSHISPKNSKWLQENLADMDVKVKSMIKLIEEDADSFRKRAEMYYRKRPELMKLVEEFYRAYRALAERYDHATGALRQAHRTMAEAFPDQVPLMLPDESPAGSSFTDAEPHAPKNLPRGHPLFDFNDLHNGTNMSKKGLRKPTAGEEEAHEEFANGWARNGKDFQNVDGKGQEDKVQQEVHLLSEENQNLRNQLAQESERADKAEAEVKNLKDTISKLESEKATVSLQCQLSQQKISSLQADISCINVDFKKLNDDLLVGTTKSRSVEDRCHQLEGEIQSLQSELGMLEGTAKKQQQELNMKQEELVKLNISMKEERERFMQAEVARLSLEKLHSQSQEEVKSLTLETQNWVEKLMNVEMSKVGLEEEIQRLKEEIASLKEQIRSSASKIKSLQDEISLLEGSKRKVENEVGMHVEEKKYLKQEVLSIKADKKELEQRHNELTEQIGAVNLNVETLQAMVRELRDGNVELKELCQKHEDERMLHLESLKFMEKITGRNSILENSLSNANAELTELREKVKTLEESCETLRGKIFTHISEKAVLVSQIEAFARNMEELSEKNGLLENSLSDVNVELEGLRGKLIALEESCHSLHDQNSGLLDEKSTLVTQVENISQRLENLKRKYAELEGKNLNMETEKDQILHQVRDLQQSLTTQKEEYETLTQSSRSHLEALENQIHMLQEKGRLKEEELEVEHHNIVHAQIEIFILQRILCDMKENNVLLSDKCQKYLETSRCQEELISELKQESLRQRKMVTWLSQYNEKLVEGIHQVTRSLNISEECQSPDALHFELLLLKIEDLKTSILDAQDDNQHLVLEKSVILTLLEQCGLDLAELQSENNVLERESKTRFEEFLALQSEKHQLLELNEHLRKDVQACNDREEVLKAEMEILCRKLSDLQEAHLVLQSDISKLIEENQSFSKKINDLSEEHDILEEDNCALVAETMKLEHLYLIFRSYYGERAHELLLVSDNVDHLHGVSCGLEQEIRLLNEKLGTVEAENMNLKESLVNLEECRRCLVILEDEVETTRHTCQELNLQIQIGKNLLMQKDMELLQINQKIEAAEDENTELNGKIEGLMMDVDEAKVAREELEKKNLTLLGQRDNEIADLHNAKDALNQQLVKLCAEVEELKRREKRLTFELEDGVQEVKSCEAEIETLLSDIHIATVNAATFEEKMLELLIKCESLEISSMIQKEMFYEEITRRSVYEDKMKDKVDTLDGENRGLKEELSAYLPLILSLGDFVTSLEQRILPLASHRTMSNKEKQDGQQRLQQKQSNAEGNEDYHALSAFGIFELQKLHTKVNALEDMVIDILSLLEHDKYVSKTTLQAPGRESEELKSKGITGLEEASIGKDIILHLKKKEETGNLKKGNTEICEDKSEQMMKDIQLDHVLSPSRYENGASSHARGPIRNHEAKDQVMELWETMDCNKMAKPSPVTSERDLECHQIEVVEEEMSVCPFSRLAGEKELSIDKLELTKSTESQEEWSGGITERLSSDAQRLSALQKSAKELKRTMETSELSDAPTSFEYNKVKTQLKEAEAALRQLIDTNKKLTKKADRLSSSSGSLVGEQTDEMGNTSGRKISERARSGRKISERARRGSEKIGRLELELQKLEYIWLKLKEEHDYKKARAAERRTRVLLRDYLYGRRESPRRKKVHCCACIRPRTKDE